MKKDRWARMNEVLKETSGDNNLVEIGQTRTMMIKEVRDGKIIGYTDNMKNVVAATDSSQTLAVGEFAQVKVTESRAFTLYGEIV